MNHHDDGARGKPGVSPRLPTRVARTFDGCGPAGPWFDSRRELVVDPDERHRILDFLRAGELVLLAQNRLPDVIAGQPDVGPADLYTDGLWVWSAAAAYFLQRYQVSPDPDLVAHMTGRSPGAQLTPSVRHAVRTALLSLSPAPLEGVAS